MTEWVVMMKSSTYLYGQNMSAKKIMADKK